jgi:hypothetical protein
MEWQARSRQEMAQNVTEVAADI